MPTTHWRLRSSTRTMRTVLVSGLAPSMRMDRSRRTGTAWILSPFMAAPTPAGSIHIGGWRGPSGMSQQEPLGRTQKEPVRWAAAAGGAPQRPPLSGAAWPRASSSRRVWRRSSRCPGSRRKAFASSRSGRGWYLGAEKSAATRRARSFELVIERHHEQTGGAPASKILHQGTSQATSPEARSSSATEGGPSRGRTGEPGFSTRVFPIRRSARAWVWPVNT